MTTEIAFDVELLARALGLLGRQEGIRTELFDLLRRAEREADDPSFFREEVRWPLVLALLRDAGAHRVSLADGLVIEVKPDSRIEKALLLSPLARPDHVWEPQTTKLLVALGAWATNVVVGGAYIGDHVLPVARAVAASGTVHAFEPTECAFLRLRRNLEINGIRNVVTHRTGLWDRSDVKLTVAGDLALASSSVRPNDAAEDAAGEVVEAMSLSDYADVNGLSSIDLIMLDTEGGEEKALLGARRFLAQPPGQAPNIVFEVHRSFVDWSDGLESTSIARLLLESDYDVFAVRDLHGNHPMAGQPIEIVPVDRVYLEGPPHGFNMLAVKEPRLIEELDLRVVPDVSPKLILEKDPALHHPVQGFASS